MQFQTFLVIVNLISLVYAQILPGFPQCAVCFDLPHEETLIIQELTMYPTDIMH